MCVVGEGEGGIEIHFRESREVKFDYLIMIGERHYTQKKLFALQWRKC